MFGKVTFAEYLKPTVDIDFHSAETFSFWYAVNGKKWQPLVEGVDASFLTSASAGGFTGTLIGPYAVK